MKNKSLYLSLAIPFLFVACATKEVQKPIKIEPTPLEKTLSQADNMALNNNWTEAYKLYSEAQKDVDDLKQYQTIQLKIANTLIQMRNYQAALAALAPMPKLPATLNDCKKLVLASEILEKMNSKIEYIEALLEVAVDNSIDEEGVIPFKAAVYSQLGQIYVKNKKVPRAIKAFEYASRLYKISGDKEKSKACYNIMEYLK